MTSECLLRMQATSVALTAAPGVAPRDSGSTTFGKFTVQFKGNLVATMVRGHPRPACKRSPRRLCGGALAGEELLESLADFDGARQHAPGAVPGGAHAHAPGPSLSVFKRMRSEKDLIRDHANLLQVCGSRALMSTDADECLMTTDDGTRPLIANPLMSTDGH